MRTRINVNPPSQTSCKDSDFPIQDGHCLILDEQHYELDIILRAENELQHKLNCWQC
jgi:hypothetical protein